MSVTGGRGVGIPIILLHDAEGGIVTIELKDGSMYCGTLEDAQDNMNCLLKDVKRTSAEGVESKLEMAYVRGSQVCFIVLPEMLKHAPFFNRIKLWRKHKGHPVMGGTGGAKGTSSTILMKSSQRRAQVERSATAQGSGGGGSGSSGAAGGGGMRTTNPGGNQGGYGQMPSYNQGQPMQQYSAPQYPPAQPQYPPAQPGPGYPPMSQMQQHYQSGAGYIPPSYPPAGYRPPG